MKKERNNKFKKALSKMKKPLMIFSIILNVLFGLALVIGLSSNNKKAQVVSASDSQEVSDLIGTTWYLKEQVYTSGTLSSSNTAVDYSLSFTTYHRLSDSYISFDSMGFRYQYSSSSPNYNYKLGYHTSNGLENVYSIRVSTPSVSDLSPVLMEKSANASIEQFNKQRTIEITGGDDVQNSTLISWFNTNAILLDTPEPTPDDYNEKEIISLGDNFNPVSYVTQNGDYILNGFAGKHTGQSTGILTLSGLTFNSNNTIFNTIKIAYGNIPATAPIVTQDGSTYMDLSSGYNDYLCCFGMFYQYVDNNNDVEKSVQVISYRRCLIDDNGVTINAYDVRPPYIIWLNNEYRTLNIISDDETIQSSSYLTISGMTTKQLLQVTSSVNTNVMGLTDVFGLLKGAFAGISGILAISILPGITLGLLLFIPLIVTIIIAVVRLIKK